MSGYLIDGERHEDVDSEAAQAAMHTVAERLVGGAGSMLIIDAAEKALTERLRYEDRKHRRTEVRFFLALKQCTPRDDTGWRVDDIPIYFCWHADVLGWIIEPLPGREVVIFAPLE